MYTGALERSIVPRFSIDHNTAAARKMSHRNITVVPVDNEARAKESSGQAFQRSVEARWRDRAPRCCNR